MIISLLLGNLLMVSIAAAAPMYSQASLQRALTRNLGNYIEETGKYPGTITMEAISAAADSFNYELDKYIKATYHPNVMPETVYIDNLYNKIIEIKTK